MKKENENGIFALLIITIIILVILVVLMATGILNFTSSNMDTNAQPITSNNGFQSNALNENDNEGNNASSNSVVTSQKSSVSKSQILSYYKERISMFENSDQEYHDYSIVDINNDDIPELLIYASGKIGNEIIGDISVFTYDENKGEKSTNYIVHAGIISGRLGISTILYKMNDGRLLSVYGHMGFESIAYFNIENDWLIRTDFSSRKTDDYMTGDTEINFVSCNDTSLIDNYN